MREMDVGLAQTLAKKTDDRRRSRKTRNAKLSWSKSAAEASTSSLPMDQREVEGFVLRL